MLQPLLSRFDRQYTQRELRPALAAILSSGEQERRIATFAQRPVISIVMATYNSDVRYLERAIRSVLRQTCTRWELCIADDASPNDDLRQFLRALAATDNRIKVKFRRTNGHMSRASNEAVALSSGEYIALFDHDDEISSDALFWLVEALQRAPQTSFFYSDEDKIDAFGYRFLPSLKPRWSPDLCLAQNYVCHLGVYRSDRLKSIGGFRVGFEGSQDHDFLLRFVAGLADEHVVHIPRVLYHWRTLPSSTAGNGVINKPYALINGHRAVQEAVRTEVGDLAKVELVNGWYQTRRRPLPTDGVSTHVVLYGAPSMSQVQQAARLLEQGTVKMTYQLHLLFEEQEQKEEQPAAFPLDLGASVVRALYAPGPKAVAAYVNRLAKRVPGRNIVLLRADIQPKNPRWLEQLTGQVERKEIGLATGKIVGSDDCIGQASWYIDEATVGRPLAVGVGVNSYRNSAVTTSRTMLMAPIAFFWR